MVPRHTLRLARNRELATSSNKTLNQLHKSRFVQHRQTKLHTTHTVSRSMLGWSGRQTLDMVMNNTHTHTHKHYIPFLRHLNINLMTGLPLPLQGRSRMSFAFEEHHLHTHSHRAHSKYLRTKKNMHLPAYNLSKQMQLITGKLTINLVVINSATAQRSNGLNYGWQKWVG